MSDGPSRTRPPAGRRSTAPPGVEPMRGGGTVTAVAGWSVSRSRIAVWFEIDAAGDGSALLHAIEQLAPPAGDGRPWSFAWHAGPRGLVARAETAIGASAKAVAASGIGPQGASSLEALSRREREVAEGVVRYGSNKAIASALGISPWTVGTHLARIYEKLGVRDRIALSVLVMPFVREGLRPARAPGRGGR